MRHPRDFHGPTYDLASLSRLRGETIRETQRWVREQGLGILSPGHGAEWLPACQFGGRGEIVDSMRDLLEVVATAGQHWRDTWAWLDTRTSVLSGAPPADLERAAADRRIRMQKLVSMAKRGADGTLPGETAILDTIYSRLTAGFEQPLLANA